MNSDITPDYFKRFTWLTPAQLRDFCLATGPVTTESVQHLRVLALNEETRRLEVPEFIKCPRCRWSHGEKGNQGGYCEKCEQIVHVFEWDEAHK